MILKWIVLGVALVVAQQWQLREVQAEDSLTNDEKALLELKEFLDENVEDKRDVTDDDFCETCDADDNECILECYALACATSCGDDDDCMANCEGCLAWCTNDDDEECQNNCFNSGNKRSFEVELSEADDNDDLDKSFGNNLAKKGWLPRIRLPRVRLPRVRLPRVRLPRIRLPRIRIPRIRLPRIRLPFGKK